MGPLKGYKIVELAGLGPGPFCCMMLGDMGADVIRVDRPRDNPFQSLDPLYRNRRTIAIDLKSAAGIDVLLRLVDDAVALVDVFRPGVAESLGFGPDVCLRRNPKLVYGRMTGWGQDGPLAGAAGHDINYMALSGALHSIGRRGQKPVPPLNLVGDFGAGGMMLAFGVVCALLEAKESGKGQVVDAAMVDGNNALMASYHGFRAMGLWDEELGTHFLSGAAHFYDTYETSDGRFVSIGPLEPKFYALLIDILGLDPERFGSSGFSMNAAEMNVEEWAPLKEELEALFRQKTCDEWCELLEGTDACFAPVLTSTEASRHPHNVARQNFVTIDNVLQHAPTPRFSRSTTQTPKSPASPGSDTRDILADAGFAADEIQALIDDGTVRTNG